MGDKKNKVNEQNFDGEGNWSGVVGMRFIFNDD